MANILHSSTIRYRVHRKPRSLATVAMRLSRYLCLAAMAGATIAYHIAPSAERSPEKRSTATNYRGGWPLLSAGACDQERYSGCATVSLQRQCCPTPGYCFLMSLGNKRVSYCCPDSEHAPQRPFPNQIRLLSRDRRRLQPICPEISFLCRSDA